MRNDSARTIITILAALLSQAILFTLWLAMAATLASRGGKGDLLLVAPVLAVPYLAGLLPRGARIRPPSSWALIMLLFMMLCLFSMFEFINGRLLGSYGGSIPVVLPWLAALVCLLVTVRAQARLQGALGPLPAPLTLWGSPLLMLLAGILTALLGADQPPIVGLDLALWAGGSLLWILAVAIPAPAVAPGRSAATGTESASNEENSTSDLPRPTAPPGPATIFFLLIHAAVMGLLTLACFGPGLAVTPSMGGLLLAAITLGVSAGKISRRLALRLLGPINATRMAMFLPGLAAIGCGLFLGRIGAPAANPSPWPTAALLAFMGWSLGLQEVSFYRVLQIALGELYPRIFRAIQDWVRLGILAGLLLAGALAAYCGAQVGPGFLLTGGGMLMLVTAALEWRRIQALAAANRPSGH